MPRSEPAPAAVPLPSSGRVSPGSPAAVAGWLPWALACSALVAGCGGGGGGEPDPAGALGVAAAPAHPASAPAGTEEETSEAQPSEPPPDDPVRRLRLLGFQVQPLGEDVPEDPDPDAVEPGVEPEAGDEALALVDVEEAAGGALGEGRAGILSAGRARPSVVGGQLATEGQFPYVVMVVAGTGACTGSILSERWVKTAAHCLPTTAGTGVAVRTGSVLLGAAVENLRVDHYVRLGDDTALLHLAQPTRFGPIAYNGDDAFGRSGPITSLGFGRTSATGPTSNLRWVENDRVQTYAGTRNGLVLGTPGSMRTTCFGDSGGPNIRFDAFGYPVDVATTSATFAPHCTGLALVYGTAGLATDIERATGVPPGAVPRGNQPPVLAPVGPVETPRGPTFMRLTATDAEGDRIVWAATGLPAGLAIDAATGVISGTTTGFSGDQPASVTVTVTDGTTGARRSTSFPWRVNTPGNLAPSISVHADRSTPAGVVTSLAVSASDPDGDALTFTARNLPPGLRMAPHGVISGAPSQGGTWDVTVAANDGRGGSASTSFNWTVVNRAPVIAPLSSATWAFAVGGVVNVPFSVSDPDGHPVTVKAAGLPAGLRVDPQARAVVGASTAAGTHLITLEATDAFGGRHVRAFTLGISQALNRPPTMTPPGHRSDLPGVQIAPVALHPHDPDGHRMQLALVGLPPGILYDPRLQALRGAPTRAGTYRVEMAIVDGFGGRTAYAPFTWTVPNEPPVLSTPQSITVAAGAAVRIPFTASDPDGHPLRLSATGLPRGLRVDAASRAIVGTALSGGVFRMTLVATDPYQGRAESAPFTLTVRNDPPLVRTSVQSRTTPVGTAVNLPLDIVDPEGHVLTLSLGSAAGLPSALPPGLRLNSAARSIAGVPNRPGVYPVAIKVSDAFGGVSYLPPFTWTITADRPVVDRLSAVTVRQGTPVSIAVTARHPQGAALTFAATGLPSGLRIDARSGLISGSTLAAPGPYVVSVVARDPYGQSSVPVSFAMTVVR
jgi:hypothetical protein